MVIEKSFSNLSTLLTGFFIAQCFACTNEHVAPELSSPSTSKVSAVSGSSKTDSSFNAILPSNISLSGYFGIDDQHYTDAIIWSGSNSVKCKGIICTAITQDDSSIYSIGFGMPTGANPFIWKNGEITSLPSDGGAVLSSIYVSAGKVYVGGYDNSSGIYWVDGAMNRLPLIDSCRYHTVDALYVSGNDIYLAGTAATAKNNRWPVYWKNGAMQYLPIAPAFSNGGQYGFSTDIIVKNGDVYVTGMVSGANFSEVAIYWKNGSPIKLDSGSALAQNIQIFQNDVYISGFNNSGAAVWKNNKLLYSGIAMNPSGLFVGYSGVYLSGTAPTSNSGGTQACWWQNGVLHLLPGPLSSATGIAVIEHDLH